MSPLLAERELVFQCNDAEVETYIGLDLLYEMPRQALPKTPVKNTIIMSLADCYPIVAAPVKTLQRQPIPEGTMDFTPLVADYPPEPPGWNSMSRRTRPISPTPGVQRERPRG